jgi:hypothetical protein
VAARAAATTAADPISNLRMGVSFASNPRKPNVSQGLRAQRSAKRDVARFGPERRWREAGNRWRARVSLD